MFCAICILRRESVGMITVMNFKYNSVVNNDSIKTSLLFIMNVCCKEIISEQSLRYICNNSCKLLYIKSFFYSSFFANKNYEYH